MKKKVTIFVVSSFIISQIFTLLYFDSFPPGYHLMVVLPILYVLGYFLFFFDLIGKSSNPFTLYGVFVMEWIRFILMPPFCAMAGNQNGVSYINPQVTSLNFAVIFMIIEFFSASIFCKIMIHPVYPKKTNPKDYVISGRKSIYYLFFTFTLGVFAIFGRGKGLVRFLIIKIQGGERVGDITDGTSLVIRQLILCSIFIAFVILAEYFYKKYSVSNNKIYFYGALIAAMINISVIVGERRSAQIYALICSIFILFCLFTSFRKKITVVLIFCSGIVLFFMSVYKFFGAFMFNSYSEAISNSQFDIPFISRTLQSYFFGPENIAISIDFFNSINQSLFQLFFDFLRSVFGLSYLFKSMGEVTSVAFNSFVYGFQKETGHVLSAIGYGYGFLGPLFVPLFGILNIYISIKLETILYKLKSLELIYLTVYILTRFVTNLFVNTPPLISQGSMMAFSSLIVIGIASILNHKKIYSEGYGNEYIE